MHNNTQSMKSVELLPEGAEAVSGVQEFLSRHHWPAALQDTLLRGVKTVPVRYFVCDDSGSMGTHDGKLLEHDGAFNRLVPCTRWTELTTVLGFHVDLAAVGTMPSQFRFLNGQRPFVVGMHNSSYAASETDVVELKAKFACSPSGGTPLCCHIRDIAALLRPFEHELRSTGQQVCVIIATDGEATDGDIAYELKALNKLPVSVIVRLCTDSRHVVKYWEKMDVQLEHNLDIIDDFLGEAEEVHVHNPWLTYGEPLQRIREFGVPMPDFDMLDECRLGLDGMKRVCAAILGEAVLSLPAPDVDMPAFMAGLDQLNATAGQVWDPITGMYKDWIDIPAFHRCYVLREPYTVPVEVVEENVVNCVIM